MNIVSGLRLVVAGLLALAVLGCGKPASDSTKMIVVASIAPLVDFARQVGGDNVEVTLLVPPGSNPHTYQIQPNQMSALSKASVLVLNGIGLEFWADKVIDAAHNPKLIVVQTADGLRVVDEDDGDEHGLRVVDEDDEDEHGNPHVWLDPVDAIHQVEAIRDAFIKADPTHAADYRKNARTFIEQLRGLDSEIREKVAGFKYKSFVTFHPTWTYFAKRYGLIQAAEIEPSPGKEPTPRDIAEAIKIARKVDAKAIFTEPQMSPKAAQVVAEEVGAKVLTLDPFGSPPGYDYIAMMRENLRKMAEALK